MPGGGYPPARRWTVHVHCSTCLGRAGLPGFQVADQGHVPRDHQSHTSQSARPTGLGLRGTPYSAQAHGLPLESKTVIYLGSGFWAAKNHLLPTCISGTGLGTIEVYSIDRVPVGTASASPGLRRVPVRPLPLEHQGLVARYSTHKEACTTNLAGGDRRSKFLCSLSRAQELGRARQSRNQLLAGT